MVYPAKNDAQGGLAIPPASVAYKAAGYRASRESYGMGRGRPVDGDRASAALVRHLRNGNLHLKGRHD